MRPTRRADSIAKNVGIPMIPETSIFDDELIDSPPKDHYFRNIPNLFEGVRNHITCPEHLAMRFAVSGHQFRYFTILRTPPTANAFSMRSETSEVDDIEAKPTTANSSARLKGAVVDSFRPAKFRAARVAFKLAGGRAPVRWRGGDLLNSHRDERPTTVVAQSMIQESKLPRGRNQLWRPRGKVWGI